MSLGALLTTALLSVGACGQSGGEQAAGTPPPAPVDVITAQAAAHTVSSELPGRIEAVRSAEVRARVAGIVLQRHFKEGSLVKAGQLLFQIDPAPLRAALAHAEGSLARAEADIFDAQARLKRYTELVDIEAVSRQEFDAAQASLKSAEAARRMAQAEVATARLNLDYAQVKAPISGRIGRALVSEGALVGQDEATPLAIIQQLDPVYADFQQPLAAALQLQQQLKQTDRAASPSPALPLAISIAGVAQPRQGRLLFSDVSVERSTGQILLRGEFPNPDGLLLPGMYVRVHVPGLSFAQAYRLPQRAVSHLPDGTAQVMLVDAENKVEARAVQTVAMQGGDWIIAAGLQPGERVIVNAATSLPPGAPVAIARTDGAADGIDAAAPVQ
ncbi:multidrug efflux system [Sterolibacterium denitrificans]|uniref:Multidrug efflux system n=2 Tax=Sterolibacterium denitrificans TaxID=157592 RepID=A0A7Z7MVB6_9PROT|nr:multidrug efflux system [Sterolibacterium denitrificans]